MPLSALSCQSHGYNMLRCGFLEADIGAKRSIPPAMDGRSVPLSDILAYGC